MKRSIPLITIMIPCIWLVSCYSSSIAQNATQQPKVGVVKEIVNGDLLCYVTFVDKKGEHNLGASFDICAAPAKYLNKKVRVYYQIESINDCQSAEPCGKTKKESIITRMKILN